MSLLEKEAYNIKISAREQTVLDDYNFHEFNEKDA